MSARSDGQKKQPKPPRERAERRYGTCAACGYRRGLRADGTVERHFLYYGRTADKCVGVGQPPREEAAHG